MLRMWCLLHSRNGSSCCRFIIMTKTITMILVSLKVHFHESLLPRNVVRVLSKKNSSKNKQIFLGHSEPVNGFAH